MAKIGDWRNDHALEIPLDGVGGVSLLVRAELHRKGTALIPPYPFQTLMLTNSDRYRLPSQASRSPNRNRGPSEARKDRWLQCVWPSQLHNMALRYRGERG